MSRRTSNNGKTNPRRILSRQDIDACTIAARAVGRETYGPCECCPESADRLMTVEHMVNGVTGTKRIPVQYITTRNRGILEQSIRG